MIMKFDVYKKKLDSLAASRKYADLAPYLELSVNLFPAIPKSFSEHHWKSKRGRKRFSRKAQFLLVAMKSANESL